MSCAGDLLNNLLVMRVEECMISDHMIWRQIYDEMAPDTVHSHLQTSNCQSLIKTWHSPILSQRTNGKMRNSEFLFNLALTSNKDKLSQAVTKSEI